MSDYPDHLNPFKRSGRSGIRESFRSMKSAFNVRFRKKHHSKDRKTLGSNNTGTLLRQDGQMANGAQVPRSETIIGTPEMFPRSRFTERMTRAQTMDFRAAHNPFEEDGDKAEVKGVREVKINGKIELENGSDTMKRRRHKKRAPLPPGTRNNLTVPGDHNTSQWSIDSCASYDTDYSSTTQMHSENEDGQPANTEGLKDIQEISKEIQQFCDTDNQEITAGQNDDNSVQAEIEKSSEMSQDEKITEEKVNGIVISENLENNEDQTTQQAESNLSITATNSDKSETNKEEKNITKLQGGDESEIMESLEEINNNLPTDCHHEETNICNNHTDVKETDSKLESQDDEKTITEETKGDKLKSCDTLEIDTNSKSDNTETASLDDDVKQVENNSEHVAYVDRKSIYIAGSTDNMDVLQNNETTLYITGSSDQLDSAAPTPKIRKHKLGREILLGSTENNLNKTSEKQ